LSAADGSLAWTSHPVAPLGEPLQHLLPAGHRRSTGPAGGMWAAAAQKHDLP